MGGPKTIRKRINSVSHPRAQPGWTQSQDKHAQNWVHGEGRSRATASFQLNGLAAGSCSSCEGWGRVVKQHTHYWAVQFFVQPLNVSASFWSIALELHSAALLLPINWMVFWDSSSFRRKQQFWSLHSCASNWIPSLCSLNCLWGSWRVYNKGLVYFYTEGRWPCGNFKCCWAIRTLLERLLDPVGYFV